MLKEGDTKIRTTPEDADFGKLVQLLDEELALRDGELHPFYARFNRLEGIRNVVLFLSDGSAVGCGALRRFDDDTVEIKRMFVRSEFRGKGIGAKILAELESWASELGYSAAVLETGKKQPEAIRLYQKSGYEIIPNFGPYAKTENSMCMKKKIGIYR
jgi:GNAT superfamily N-acetyltransferase